MIIRRFLFSLFLMFVFSLLIFLFVQTDPVAFSPQKEPLIYFCGLENCTVVLAEFIRSTKKEISCAFFDLDHPEVWNAFLSLDSDIKKLVYSDKDNQHHTASFVFYDSSSAFMHHKFCIRDGQFLLTGSFNPTLNADVKNENSVLLFSNTSLVSAYEEEFVSLFPEVFTRKDEESNQLPVCFSPRKDCIDFMNTYLLSANESIKGMFFTFTHAWVAHSLLLKLYEGVNVSLLFDRTSLTRYSAYHLLSPHGVSLCTPKLKGKLHHKVFIIDERLVIVGSMNPTKNAQKRNNENTLIIDDSKVAEKYLNEFRRLELLCQTL